MKLEPICGLSEAMRFALAAAAMIASGAAWGGGSHALSVGARVLSAGNCQFNGAGPSALSFGAIDPSSSSDSTASVDIPYRCNGGSAATVSWSVASDDGLHKSASNTPRLRHVSNPAQYLRYSLYTPAPGASAKNVDLTMTVKGTMAAADFQDALAGNYADTVVLTITP